MILTKKEGAGREKRQKLNLKKFFFILQDLLWCVFHLYIVKKLMCYTQALFIYEIKILIELRDVRNYEFGIIFLL